MSKVDCKDCQLYHNGGCDELGEYTTPGERECSWFTPKVIKKTCVAEIAKIAKQTVFDRLTASPEVLAPKLVYWEHDDWGSGWTSNLIDEVYNTESEAIAATVAKLKEQVQ